MYLDLIYEMANEKPFDALADREVLTGALEQIQLADELGYNCIWEVEHHFLTEFSHSSAPEIFLGAVSQRTERIRLGAGVTLLPFPFNHPIRVAERIAVLDLISNGRVEFGTGRSSEYEQQGFGISPQESRAMWQEAIEIIPRMWRQHPFSYEGRFFSIPERDIVPRPLQKPHPPMWSAATSPESWRLAAANGLGVLGFALVASLDEFKANIDDYRERIHQARPVGEFVNNQVGAFSLVYCAPDNQQAQEDAFEACVWYTLKSYELLQPRSAHGGWQALTQYGQEFMQALSIRSREMYRLLNTHGSVIVGDPEHCIQKLQAYKEMGVDRMICAMALHGLSHQQVMRSIDLFGKEVLPVFSSNGS